MSKYKTSLNFRFRQTGFTLIDLLVGLVLGLIALAAVGTLYVTSSKNYAVQEGHARLQESARTAIAMLTRDLRLAGYFGCPDDLGVVFNHVNSTSALDLFDIRNPIEGFEQGTTQWLPSTATTAINKIVPNTDAFKVKYLDPDSAVVVETPYMTDASGALHVTANNSLQGGDIIGITDCDHTDIFQITNNNPGNTGTVDHATGQSVSPGNARLPNITQNCPGQNAHCLSKVYEDDAFLMKLIGVVYFIGRAGPNPSDPNNYDPNNLNNPPALFRVTVNTSALLANQVEVVPGIENMQILYGEDLNGDRQPDEYRKANAVTSWGNVVAVRIGILARTQAQTRYGTKQELGGAESADKQTYDIDLDGTADAVATGETNRRVQRHPFVTTVLLRNLKE